MTRTLARLLPPYAVRSVRITVDWRKGRIRRLRVEYRKQPLLRRVINMVRW